MYIDTLDDEAATINLVTVLARETLEVKLEAIGRHLLLLTVKVEMVLAHNQEKLYKVRNGKRVGVLRKSYGGNKGHNSLRQLLGFRP